VDQSDLVHLFVTSVAPLGQAGVEVRQGQVFNYSVPVFDVPTLTPGIKAHGLFDATHGVGDHIHRAQVVFEQHFGASVTAAVVGPVGLESVDATGDGAPPSDGGASCLFNALDVAKVVGGLGGVVAGLVGSLVAAVVGSVAQLGGVIALLDTVGFVEGGVFQGATVAADLVAVAIVLVIGVPCRQSSMGARLGGVASAVGIVADALLVGNVAQAVALVALWAFTQFDL